MKKILPVLFFILLLAISFSAQTQKPYVWLPDGTYDETVPTPKDFFGYEIGDYLTDNLQMVAYIKELEKRTNRVRVFQYGESVERRKLWIVAISNPENMQK